MADSSGAPAVSCCRLTKSYGTGDTQVAALRGVDLEVRRGEILILSGPSGCGKTTLISIVAGILEQDSGDCVVLGQDLRGFSASQRASFRGAAIGFVFQSFNLLPALTTAENVAVPLLIRGVPRKLAGERARAALEVVGLGRRATALPGELSGGQQQRVAIARALVHEPQLVLCDEPTSNLDHATGREMMEILRASVRRPDRALIVVTHDARILSFADRVARMDDGRIVEVFAGAGEGVRV
ncbi:MAG: ABC transporter ATP-binding protein [Thermoanaerobaculia bacterium]